MGTNEPSKRLFFALWPTDEVRRDLTRVLRRTCRDLRCKPMRPANIHLTLAFLGQVPVSKVPCLESLAAACRAPAFELRLDRLGYWARPKVLWLSSDDRPAPLQRLYHQLNTGLVHCGLTPEGRPFVPHVTLARKLTQAVPEQALTPILWPVEYFVLVQSFTRPEGVEYRPIQRWPLDAQGVAWHGD